MDLKEAASTNDAHRELAKARAPEGTVVIADEQTAGHGLQPRRVSPLRDPRGTRRRVLTGEVRLSD
jgi:hypothetical protein